MTEVRVCAEMFPNREHPERSGFPMEIALKDNLDILIKNIKDDWDFTILITGGGGVRVGKSVLGMQISCYVYYQMRVAHGENTIFDTEKCFVFTGDELIKKGHYLGQNHPYSPLQFDEAGADLEGRKVITGSTQKVLDYFRECGQYNLFNVLIIPEFFDLPKGIALSRSIFLLDVYCSADPNTGKFKRGYFNFYSRPNKKKLYLRGKKDLNYKASRYDFHGRFYNFYPIDEANYRKLKLNAMLKRDETKIDKKTQHRNTALKILSEVCGFTGVKIKELFNSYSCQIGTSTISTALDSFKEDEREIPKESPEIVLSTAI